MLATMMNGSVQQTVGVEVADLAPPVLTVRGSPRKCVVLALVMLMLSVVAWHRVSRAATPDLFFEILAAAFLIAAAVVTYQAARRLPRITLSSSGFELATGIATRQIPWSDCGEFRIQNHFGRHFVAYSRAGIIPTGMLLNQFECTTSDLVELLNSWRIQHPVALSSLVRPKVTE